MRSSFRSTSAYNRIRFGPCGPRQLPPVDRCRGDAEFSRLRSELQKVVAKRDLDGLLSLMSDDVKVSFGGASGRERFSDYWTASEQDRELLWSELGSALRLGCAQAMDGEGKPYKAIPGMFVTGDDLDGFSTWVSLPGAILRSKPDAKSQAKMRLPAWTVLGEVEHDGGSWIEVRTPKGRGDMSRPNRRAACSIIASSSGSATANGASPRSSRATDATAPIAPAKCNL